MPITLRNQKGSALTYTELDDNFLFLSTSYVQSSLTSSMTVLSSSFSTSASFSVSSSKAVIASTSSYVGALNQSVSITGSVNISGSINANYLYKTQKVYLSVSALSTLDTNPVQAIPSAGPGKVVVPIEVVVRTGTGSIGWSTSSNIALRPSGSETGNVLLIIASTQSSPLSVPNYVTSEKLNTIWGSPTTGGLEFAGSQGLNPSGGDMDAYVYITYQIVEI